MARETQPAHAARHTRGNATIAGSGGDGHADRSAVLHRRADVELHRVGHAATGEIRTSIQNVAVLARSDVGLTFGPHAHLLGVGSACRLAAHTAAEHRVTALGADDAAARPCPLLHLET